MTQRPIKTVDDAIDALGGTSATARLMLKKPQHVSNWRAEKRIAAETFLMFKRELRSRRLSAPSSLWGITQPVPKKRKKKIRSS